MNAAGQGFEAALRTWLARQATAEERLTSFAFREGQPAIVIPAPSSHAELRRWILASVADPETAAFLRLLGDAGRTMTELAFDGALGARAGDRVSLAARVGALAAGGLVARDLEGDRVAVTDLGRAALDLAGGQTAGAHIAATAARRP